MIDVLYYLFLYVNLFVRDCLFFVVSCGNSFGVICGNFCFIFLILVRLYLRIGKINSFDNFFENIFRVGDRLVLDKSFL